ncbi:MAG TPA: copper homeostasis protein CutC [Fimbriimonadaceae bacterium]|nr:copper homeostasis protein CutC [Fimbriimonadaceae bacterium]
MARGVCVEAVACSVEDALAAQRAGACRIELCSAIELGGLTPSIGLAREVLAACDLPVVAMLRPRAGGFVYSRSELATMRRDAEALVDAGVHGLAFGVLDAGGRVDVETCRNLIQAADGRETVFHRAFDTTRDPYEALDAIASLGMTRILTAGHAEKASDGASLLRELRERAAERIGIMAGGGIRADNIRYIIETSGVDQVHLGPFRKIEGGSGLYSEPYGRLDEDQLRQTVAQVNNGEPI